MKGKRFSTEEKVRILREVDAGKSVVEVCREKNISDVTYHRWRQQFGHLDLNEAKRLKELEKENTELKKMLAEAMRVIIAFSGSNTVDTLLIGISWILTGTPFPKRDGVMGDGAD